MTEPYVGEIRLFAFNRLPPGWLFCQGQEEQIQKMPLLHAAIGTTYGGDGVKTFRLPDLRGRAGIHCGAGTDKTSAYTQGRMVGVEAVSLTVATTPPHFHVVQTADVTGTTAAPAGHYFARPVLSSTYEPVAMYSSNPMPQVPLNPAAVGSVGGGQAHNNMQPFVVLAYAIAYLGVFSNTRLINVERRL